jgi:hypothetical protein
MQEKAAGRAAARSMHSGAESSASAPVRGSRRLSTHARLIHSQPGNPAATKLLCLHMQAVGKRRSVTSVVMSDISIV